MILSSDAEGNRYSPLCQVDVGAWNSNFQNVELLELTEADVANSYTEEDVIDGQKAVILYPS
ncbi:hypothetical protein ACQ4M3_01155 [Leptolyngbya sp. AN03gr2]|uniref:hypothetical protein n=1 Tax=unclassified Leptolyngbya TaxID=2650499 RepID=UPI003D31BD5D